MSKNNRRNRRDRQMTEEKKEVVEETTFEDTPKIDSPLPEITMKEEVVEKAEEKEEVPVPSPEPKVEVPKKQEPKPQPKPVPVVGTSMTQDVEQKLIIYVDKMSSDIEDKEVGKVQYGFFQLLRSILKDTNADSAHSKWNALLRFANKNSHNVFNEMVAFSSPQNWPGSNVEFSIFRRVMWVILQTKDPKTRRANVATCLSDKTVEGLTQVERNNLLNFYS